MNENCIRRMKCSLYQALQGAPYFVKLLAETSAKRHKKWFPYLHIFAKLLVVKTIYSHSNRSIAMPVTVRLLNIIKQYMYCSGCKNTV